MFIAAIEELLDIQGKGLTDELYGRYDRLYSESSNGLLAKGSIEEYLIDLCRKQSPKNTSKKSKWAASYMSRAFLNKINYTRGMNFWNMKEP